MTTIDQTSRMADQQELTEQLLRVPGARPEGAGVRGTASRRGSTQRPAAGAPPLVAASDLVVDRHRERRGAMGVARRLDGGVPRGPRNAALSRMEPQHGLRLLVDGCGDLDICHQLRSGSDRIALLHVGQRPVPGRQGRFGLRPQRRLLRRVRVGLERSAAGARRLAVSSPVGARPIRRPRDRRGRVPELPERRVAGRLSRRLALRHGGRVSSRPHLDAGALDRGHRARLHDRGQSRPERPAGRTSKPVPTPANSTIRSATTRCPATANSPCA